MTSLSYHPDDTKIICDFTTALLIKYPLFVEGVLVSRNSFFWVTFRDNLLYDERCIKAIWEMRVIAVYDDEREEIKTYVSTYDMQGQSIKAN